LGQRKTGLIKIGDSTCQQIEVDLKNTLRELKQQYQLTPELKKQAEKEAKELRKEYEKTDSYAEWKKRLMRNIATN